MLLLIGAILLCSFTSYCQTTSQELINEINSATSDTFRIDKLEQLALSLLGTNPIEAISYAQRGREIAIEIEDLSREAKLIKAIGLGHYYKAEYRECLVHWEEALGLFEVLSDQKGTANIYSNLGSLYEATGDMQKALEYHLESLKIAESNNDSLRVATVNLNLGVVNYNMRDLESSMDYYNQSLEMCKLLGYDQCIGLSYLNISEVYRDLDSLDKAVEFVNRAIDIFQTNSDPLLPSAVVTSGRYAYEQGNFENAMIIAQEAYQISKDRNLNRTMQLAKNVMGNVHLAHKEYDLALEEFKEAIELGEDIGPTDHLVEAYEGFILATEAIGDVFVALAAKDSLMTINERIFFNSNNTLKTPLLKYDLEKRESEIELLNKENQVKELTLDKVRRDRNGLAVLALVMLVLSSIIFWLYRKVNIERKRSDELLLNILPAETANELKQKGFTSARSYDNVAIMFTDFEGFSKSALDLTPHELVKSIDCYFKKFDEISAAYNLEKIKTIGDSYLVASGLGADKDDASLIVEAALKMQEFVNTMLNNPSNDIKEPFPMRIGIHLGPVVAGVVGVKKFQYDIWGNTVNIASRIESTGQSGKVAISEILYNEIKSNSAYRFEKREQIDVKNIGIIQTYFVKRA